MTLREIEPSAMDAGGHTAAGDHARNAPDPSASHDSDAHRYENAGAGIALDDRPEAQGSCGDPTLSEPALYDEPPMRASRARGAARKTSEDPLGTGGSNLTDQPNVVVETAHLLAGPDGGQSSSADLASVAAVTSFDRSNVALSPIHGMTGQDGGHPGSEDLSTPAAVHLSEPASVAVATAKKTRARGGGQGSSASPSGYAPAKKTRRAVQAAQTEQRVLDGGDGQCSTAETHSPAAVANLSEPANERVNTPHATRDHGGGQRASGDQIGTAAANLSRPVNHAVDPNAALPDGGDGQTANGIPHDVAVAKSSRRTNRRTAPKVVLSGEGDGHVPNEGHSSTAVATIVDLWRQRQQLRKTQASLGLQAQAMCRRYLNGDKEAAQKAWGLIQKGKGDADLAVIVQPYIEGGQPFERNAHLLEKQLAKLVRTLPIWTWAKDVRGLGELSVAGLIGEASGNPGDYKSVSALWKRMGLAVIGGERQRRVTTAEAALLHGYAPQRRAFAYVISCNLMKSQGTEGKYRAVYDRRKAYELERQIEVKGVMEPVTKAHAHNRALRVMVKELLKDMWAADRRLRRASELGAA